MLRFILSVFFYFSISRHSIVIHREICVNDFSVTTAARFLTFGTNVGYELLCKRESASCFFFHALYLSIFLFHQIFRYRFRCGTEHKTAEIYFALFCFSIAYSNVIHRGSSCQIFLMNCTIVSRIL